MSLHRTPVHTRALRDVRDGKVEWHARVGVSGGFTRFDAYPITEPDVLVALYELRNDELLRVVGTQVFVTTKGASCLRRWANADSTVFAHPQAGGGVVSDRQPRKGDRVRITYEAEYLSEAEALGPDGTVVYPVNSTVEVLEPADDPTMDKIGTVRQDEQGDIWVSWETETEYTWGCITVASGRRRHDELVGCPVIGYVPGTPAAEANPVPPQVLERVRELLTNGQQARAVKAIREASPLGLTEARAYAESLPEWRQREQELHDWEHDLPHSQASQVDPHAPQVLVRSAYNEHKNTHRPPLVEGCEWCVPELAPNLAVYHADGPEPPANVTCLRYLDDTPNATRTPFLRRTEVGWVWATETSTIITRQGIDWADAVRDCPGRYEVVQP